MSGVDLTFIGLTDLAGLLRGKAVPAVRVEKGVGWVPTNALITCFDALGDGPYGSLGDLVLHPDPDTQCHLPGIDDGPDFRLVLAEVRYLDGNAWDCCTRTALRRALARFESASGETLLATFEQEFQMVGMQRPPGDAFGFHGYRAAEAFGRALMDAMTALGFGPEQFIREYGADQFEVTMAPATAMQAADRATVFRALVRDIAPRFGHRATFAPISGPEATGNGVHIHFSLRDADGLPGTYDPTRPGGLSVLAGKAVAGILKYLHEIVALLAPSVVSYQRLTPHRWSAAYSNLGDRDREAAVRICPVRKNDPALAEKFNLEVRAVDATASPHLALAVLVHAMAEGIEKGMAAPSISTGDLSLLDSDTLASRGIHRLPTSLSEALRAFEASGTVHRWFGEEFVTVYAAHKNAEIAYVEAAGDRNIFDLYRASY